MASTHALYQSFNGNIKLTESKKDGLRTSRNAIRDDIESWLSSNNKSGSRFKMQGSFAMHTAVNPINGDEFDIDDGLYLTDFEDTEKSGWPSCDAVHNWVVSAVEDRTTAAPSNKNTCVRVSYGHGYHVDIPVYIKTDGMPHLAHKTKGWIKSDAEGFVAWLNDKADSDGQLKRIVRYLKRWKDYCNVPLKGVELTILAANNFSKAQGRDDDAVRYTVEGIKKSLEIDFACRKPVAPWEDLFEDISQTKRETILSKLAALLNALNKAKNAEDERSASNHLRNVFGDDFPKGDSSKRTSSYVTTTAPAVLKHDGRSG